MPAPAIGGAIASIGGSLLSGGAQRRASKKAAQAQQGANDGAQNSAMEANWRAVDARYGGLREAGRLVDAGTAARIGGYDAAAATETAGIGRIRDLLKPYVDGGAGGGSGGNGGTTANGGAGGAGGNPGGGGGGGGGQR